MEAFTLDGGRVERMDGLQREGGLEPEIGKALSEISEMDSITLAPDFLKILNNNKLVLTN